MAKMTDDKALRDVWKKRLALYTEGGKLRAEAHRIYSRARKVRAEADKLRAEVNKLWAEADKLQAEGDRLWAEAVLAHRGNVTLDWRSDEICVLGTGEVFSTDKAV